MASRSYGLTDPNTKPFGDPGEESKGLLADAEESESLEIEAPSPQAGQSGWSNGRVTRVSVFLILLILCGVFANTHLYRSPPPTYAHLHFNGATLRSNGTHDFKRTVLMVSIDGLRADYLDRGLTPHLLHISKQGIRAKYITPVFPTLTFPNHWSLMTGLYAESHGIIANNFWDPESNSEFHYNRQETSWNASWWGGEPMWETAGKAGVLTANLMWPGPPKTITGASPTYFVPFRNHVPLGEKLDQILHWIDLPLEQRPQLITAYEPSVDQAGHQAGPNSPLVNETLRNVDVFAKDLHTAMKRRNLTAIVDIIFVSDHGMTDTSHPDPIFVDDVLGKGFGEIEHEDGWPSMGLRFYPGANTSHYLDLLHKAADSNPEKFSVYTHATMPERFHFSHSPRIAPIWILPKIGYALTNHKEESEGTILGKGNHGYDNREPAMQAVFIAHGPFSMVSKGAQASRGLFSLFSRSRDKCWHTVDKDTYIMKGFQNVEINGLVMKLLGLEDKQAPTNGTEGFWDKYF